MDRRGGGGRKTLLAPIHFIFKLLQQRETVSIWLYEQLLVRIEGKIRVRARPTKDATNQLTHREQGFDEFMNLVIDDAVEVQLATKEKAEKRRQLGQILLKGDNVSLIQAVQL
jgi:small nuclear ribonucleoprotein E